MSVQFIFLKNDFTGFFINVCRIFLNKRSRSSFLFLYRDLVSGFVSNDCAISWFSCYLLCHHQCLQDLKLNLVKQIAFKAYLRHRKKVSPVFLIRNETEFLYMLLQWSDCKFKYVSLQFWQWIASTSISKGYLKVSSKVFGQTRTKILWAA